MQAAMHGMPVQGLKRGEADQQLDTSYAIAWQQILLQDRGSDKGAMCPQYKCMTMKTSYNNYHWYVL